MTSAEMHTEPTATSSTDERLLLSGGGLRAMVGSVGVILYLMYAGRWTAVREIVSVSGGSAVNAALLTSGGWKDERTDVERLSLFTKALVNDRAMPKTGRRVTIVAVAVALLGGLVALIVLAIASWPAWVALIIGVCAFPVALQLGRRIGAAYLRDVLRTTLDLKGRDKATLTVVDNYVARRGGRQHFFAVSGLVSRAPYFFWVGGSHDVETQQRDGKMSWGTRFDPLAARTTTRSRMPHSHLPRCQPSAACDRPAGP